MGRLRVIKSGPMATIQDFGRFGYRRYGVPQSGAMDPEMMKRANEIVGNPHHFPAVEFALMGLKLEAVEKTSLSVVGASLKVNGILTEVNGQILNEGDQVEISAPDQVYAYVGIGGKIKVEEHLESVSTYLMAGFGGIDGRSLRASDELISDNMTLGIQKVESVKKKIVNPVLVRFIKGPEWKLLQDDIESKTFEIDPSSNRMGIRLKGDLLKNDYQEIASSAVIPGTIQLPANGIPIVLMNDCQTTGGYPRIGKVVDEDLGKLAQVRAGSKIRFVFF